MPIDRKQFVLTANGKQIRLLPENYGVFTREQTADWKLYLDPAVPSELAAKVFKVYHDGDGVTTAHSIRWGDKELALDALNALVKHEDVDTTYNTDWEPDGRVEVRGSMQYLWFRYCDGRDLYQITPTQSPPQTRAGYCNQATMLKQRGYEG